MGRRTSSQPFLDFAKTWLISFGKISYCSEDNDKFDWESAHQQGIEVARRLKIELGGQADVRYVRPTEDPGYNREEGYELLIDGSVFPIRRL